jgi:hypothetical protein
LSRELNAENVKGASRHRACPERLSFNQNIKTRAFSDLLETPQLTLKAVVTRAVTRNLRNCDMPIKLVVKLIVPLCWGVAQHKHVFSSVPCSKQTRRLSRGGVRVELFGATSSLWPSSLLLFFRSCAPLCHLCLSSVSLSHLFCYFILSWFVSPCPRNGALGFPSSWKEPAMQWCILGRSAVSMWSSCPTFQRLSLSLSIVNWWRFNCLFW